MKRIRIENIKKHYTLEENTSYKELSDYTNDELKYTNDELKYTNDELRHLLRYINSTSFKLLHYKEIVHTQSWLYLKGLDNLDNLNSLNTNITTNVNKQFNEYYLSETPIKVMKVFDKYYIIDGHHRFYRGILRGYLYFLVEINSLYCPCSYSKADYIDVFYERPPNTDFLYDNDNYKDYEKYTVGKFDNEYEEKIEKLQKVLNIQITK